MSQPLHQPLPALEFVAAHLLAPIIESQAVPRSVAVLIPVLLLLSVAVAVLEPTIAAVKVEYAALADCRDLLITTAFESD